MIDAHKSCSVFGHREIEITENLKEKIKLIFEDLIEKEGVKYFYFGGFGEFDNLCWEIVSDLKKQYPHICRIFCLSDPRHQRISKRPKWLKSDDYEEIIYLDLQFDYWYSRLYYRNCEIINRSDFVVFYVEHTERSGAYKAMQYAKKSNKHILNIPKMQ